MSLSIVEQQILDDLGNESTMARDYASIINWDVNRIARWTDSWTDYTITDPGILFVNAISFLYDQLNFRLDNLFLDNILRYSKSDERLYYMAKFLGLDLQGYEASQGYVRVENHSPQSLKFPENFLFYVYDKALGKTFYFRTQEEKSVSKGSAVNIKVMEGQLAEFVVNCKDISDSFTLEFEMNTIAVNSFKIGVYDPSTKTVSNYFTKVDDAFLSIYSFLTYSVHFANDKIIVKLCPGLLLALGEDAQLFISLHISEGSLGNLSQVVLSSTDMPLISDTERADKKIKYLLKFTLLGTNKGITALSREQVRNYIGQNNWRVNTLVTDSDVQYLLKRYPDLIRIASEQDEKSNFMSIYYTPVEKPEDLGSTIEQLKSYLDENMICGQKYSLEEVEYRQVDIIVNVTLCGNTSDTSILTEDIIALLKRYLARENQPNLFVFRLRDVSNLITEAFSQVVFTSIEEPLYDIETKLSQLIVLGNITARYFKQEGAIDANTR